MLEIDEQFVIDVLQGLVRINSVNPSLSATGRGEAEIGEYTARRLRDVGMDVQVHEPHPGRVSVVGKRKGQGKGKALMLNAHYDTVPVDGMADPFSGAVRGGRLYGRGAYDMKGSLAACIGAVKALHDAGVRLAGDLYIAAVADEEVASIGTMDVLRHYTVDAAIVTEPSALQICLAHKGFQWIEVQTRGRAAHGSQFEIGIDANARMGPVLVAVAGLARELQRRSPHPLVGPPSLHAAVLTGGTGWSTYAANCTLQIERRSVPGETETGVLAELRALLEPLSTGSLNPETTLRLVLSREPFEVAPSAAIVRALTDAASKVLGHTPAYVGENPWMDAALFAARGVETVVIGPVGAGAHAEEEWVDLESVLKLTKILAGAALLYCGEQPSHRKERSVGGEGQ